MTLYIDLLLTLGFSYLGSATVSRPENKFFAGLLTGLLGGTIRALIYKQDVVWIKNPDYIAAVAMGVSIEMLMHFR